MARLLDQYVSTAGWDVSTRATRWSASPTGSPNAPTAFRQFDDDDGLARLITGWARLPAAVIADRIRAAVDDFAAVPPHDDVAVLVLAARPRDAYFR